MAINVWAESVDVRGVTCSDARLQAGNNESTKYPAGSKYGQAGWDIGLKFPDLDDLSRRLSQFKQERGQPIGRLAIHAHGVPGGTLYVEGELKAERALTSKTVQELYAKQLDVLGTALSPNATVLLVGCLAGARDGGTELLRLLSQKWRGKTVVAFTTIGYYSGGDQSRPGQACSEPGMRDTDYTTQLQDREKTKIAQQWGNLEQLPWASEKSKHAKVAVNGVVKGPPESPDYSSIRPWREDKELSDLWAKYVKYRLARRDTYSVEFDILQLKTKRIKQGITLSGEFGPNAKLPPWEDKDNAFEKFRKEAQGKAAVPKKKAR